MTDLHQKRTAARRQIIKLVIGFAAATLALFALYSLKPDITTSRPAVWRAKP